MKRAFECWRAYRAPEAERISRNSRWGKRPRPCPYSAFSPDVPGCAAVGDTQEETRRNFQDALAAHFEAMREIGEPIPEPRASVDYVEVAA